MKFDICVLFEAPKWTEVFQMFQIHIDRMDENPFQIDYIQHLGHPAWALDAIELLNLCICYSQWIIRWLHSSFIQFPNCLDHFIHGKKIVQISLVFVFPLFAFRLLELYFNSVHYADNAVRRQHDVADNDGSDSDGTSEIK